MTPEEYVTYDGLGLAELVRSGEVRADELAELALERIAALNPSLNAVVHSLEERARAQLLAGLPDGPFTGVPSLLKDMLDVEGTLTTMGSAILADFHSPQTHPLARRLEASGLVFLGRTNMSELGLLPTTEPALYGPTRNPWNLGHSPGGSSGGSGAAVAAGMVPLAYAADGGGSIRIPASANGLFGLKPSRGRHPRLPTDEPDGFAQHHALTRSVRDSAALLDFTCQRKLSPSGRWWVPPPERSYQRVAELDPEPLRIAFTTRDLLGRPVHPSCAEAILLAAERCEELGHHVEERPFPVDGEAFSQAFGMLWFAVGGVFMKLISEELHQSALPTPVQRLLQRYPRALRSFSRLPLGPGRQPLVGRLLRRLAQEDAQSSASDLWLAQLELQRAGTAMEASFEHHDLWLTTVLAQPPWPTGHLDAYRAFPDIAEQLWAYIAFNPIANATGLPACSVPTLVTDQGLPIGAEFWAPAGREDRLFAVAGQLERAFPWPLPPVAPSNREPSSTAAV